MNWNISFLLISGVLIQLLGETHAVCNHPSRVSTCKTNVGLDVIHPVCFLKKTYTNGGVMYERGGTNETMCRKNAAYSSLSNPDCKSPNPPVNTVCYDCCIALCPESRFCNQENNINPNFMPSYMQTGSSGQHTTAAPTTSKPTTPMTIPATTTPVPTTTPTTTTTTPATTTTTPTTTTTTPTTTTAPTTTSAPTTLPTTLLTTTPTTVAITTPIPTTLTTTVTTITSTTPTTVITTSAAVNGTKCLVCTEDQSTSCSSMDYTVCSGDRPYCLNEIIYQNGNWTKTLHRCASRVECYWDYWIGTGNGTECIQNGVCTYCCQGPDGKPCNARTEKPTNLTNFGQTQNRAYKCAVTGPQNSNTIQDCPPSERFCLNDVYYDTDPNTNNLITRDVRRCASQEQCKGKWLQSRKTDACLTGNMTGVDASKTGNRLLCHYCCVSNATTPCNLHPKPDQIKLFIQPTTIPIVSTSLPVVSTSLPAVSSTFLTNATTIMTTNATTIMTTNSTTISTTAVPTTPTTPKAKVYCHQCGDTSNGIPCSSRQVTTSQPKECNGAYQYCMTDIIQDSNGNADVYKRCVTDHICRKEWIVESADEDYCKRYGVVTNPSAFNCHFCCTSDGCNSDLVPNSTTWYKLHN